MKIFKEFALRARASSRAAGSGWSLRPSLLEAVPPPRGSSWCLRVPFLRVLSGFGGFAGASFVGSFPSCICCASCEPRTCKPSPFGVTSALCGRSHACAVLWHFLHVTDRVRVQSITWWIHADIRWFIFELQPALPDSDFSSEEELLPRRAG